MRTPFTDLSCYMSPDKLTFLRRLEVQPSLLEAASLELAIFGLCTGLVAAASVATCKNLSEVLNIADETVELAFFIGLEAPRRSTNIESSSRSWATLVSNVDTTQVHEAMTAFNQNIPQYDRKVYISASNGSSITISGPPSIKAEILRTPPFSAYKKVSLPITAAFHAGHLDPIPMQRFKHRCAGLRNRPLRHSVLISTSTGETYCGERFDDILPDLLEDIYQRPIDLGKSTLGLSKALKKSPNVLQLGPSNLMRSLAQSLKVHGVELEPQPELKLAVETSRTSGKDIAIVGMGIRLPGSETLEEFWKVLEEGRDLHEKIRPDRFDAGSHCDPTGEVKNTTLTPYGVFIDRPGFFDTRLFNMSPREASQTDPQQRLLLLATYEALEMAGYTPNGTASTDRRRIGTYIGQTSDDYREVNASQDVDTFFITGGIRAFGPGRVNYHFGWEGPSYSVDTACSSSAASIQLACSALLARECDTAVGGGVNFLTASDLFAGLSRGGFLSKTGGCKTFDDSADGYVRADAVGVVVLKRLDDAISDRDNILAVLRGTATNHSAEAVSITHPHAATQERLFHSVLEQSGLEACDIDYAELHGTGTQAGDATESRSVTNVLAKGRLPEHPLYLGTVKPNLGHGEAGSGVTSLIKAIMMLRKNMIPPHVGIKNRMNPKLPSFSDLNTKIAFKETPFLPRPGGDGKRKILINNFDAAGGNTSIVIEDPPVLQIEGEDPRNYHVVTVSGKTTYSVLENSRNLIGYLKAHPEVKLEDIAYTTTARRMHHTFRDAYAVSSKEELIVSLEKSVQQQKWAKKLATPTPIVFVFTGQGSQYNSMAAELYATSPVFRSIIEDCDRLCLSHGFGSFLPIITDKDLDISLASPVHVQLSVVAVELAISALWKSLGVKPTAVIGHSLGEFAAFCVAGVVSLSDCLYLVGKRATLLLEMCESEKYAMLVVQRDVSDTTRMLEESGAAGCEIACINSPTSTVVSGPCNQIKHLEAYLQSSTDAVKTALVKVQYGFHSEQMVPLLPAYEAVCETVQFSTPSITVASTLLGRAMKTGEAVDAKYLVSQTRQQVRFVDALLSLSQAAGGSTSTWIETGPHPMCLGLVRATLPAEQVFLPSLKRGEDNWKTLSQSIALAYKAGCEIDWRAFHCPFELALSNLELPSYAFDLKNYWIQYQGDWALRKGQAVKSSISSEYTKPQFLTTALQQVESELHDASHTEVVFVTDASEPKLNKALRGHLVNGAGLCPSSVYADMAFTAAGYIRKLRGQPVVPMDVRDMEVYKPLLINEDTKQKIRVTAAQNVSDGFVEVKFSSQDGSSLADHAHCKVQFDTENIWKSDWQRNAYLVKSRMDHLKLMASKGSVHKILRPMVYKLFSALVDYDEKYQGLEQVFMDSQLLEATADVKFQTDDSDGTFTYSPYWIDSLAHLSGFVLNGAETTPKDAVFISHGWKSMKIVGQLSTKKHYQSYVRMQETKTRGVFAGDVYFFEEQQIVAVCEGLQFQRIKRSVLDHLLPPTKFGGMQNQDKTSLLPQIPNVVPIVPKAEAVQKMLVAASGSRISDVLEAIASEIGLEVQELDEDTDFTDLGVDSLLTLSIIARLSKILDEHVPATFFIQYPNVRQLRAYLSLKGSSSPGSSGSRSPSDNSDIGSDGTRTPETEVNIAIVETGKPSIVDRIKEIFSKELDLTLSELDNDVSLVELGVDSLLSLSILSSIKSRTGLSLPSSFLFEKSTMAEVLAHFAEPAKKAIMITTPTRPTPDDSLGSGKYQSEAILLHESPDSNQLPFFLLPDGSGSAGSYVELASLGLGVPVYGLNSPYLKNPKEFRTSIEELASIFLHEMRRIQPHGSYRLGGWSIGGTYAFEMARQLVQKHGLEVQELILIDAPCPKALPPLDFGTIDLLGQLSVIKPRSSKLATMSDGVRDHFIGSIDALSRYKPVPFAGVRNASIIWAKHGVWERFDQDTRRKYQSDVRGPNAAGDWMMNTRSDFGPCGWDEILSGTRVGCEVVAGDHFSIMQRPGALVMATNIRKTFI